MGPASHSGEADVACSGCCLSRYTGEKIHDERIEVLLEAAWRPAPEGAFPDLPQSPRANGGAGPSFVPPPAASGYVAPHLRGANGALAPTSPIVGSVGCHMLHACNTGRAMVHLHAGEPSAQEARRTRGVCKQAVASMAKAGCSCNTLQSMAKPCSRRQMALAKWSGLHADA